VRFDKYCRWCEQAVSDIAEHLQLCVVRSAVRQAEHAHGGPLPYQKMRQIRDAAREALRMKRQAAG
jgi:hypothetical protein